VLIVGSGAVATLIAERMAQAQLPFQVFGSSSDRLVALDSRFGPVSVTEPEKIESHRHWVICLKTWQNPEKLALLQEAPAPESVLSLQNGFTPSRIWQALGDVVVERGISTYGVKVDSPGTVIGGKSGAIVLRRGSHFLELLQACGFNVCLTDDLGQAVWHKLAVNASLNIVACLWGLRNGEILQSRAARRAARAASAEVQQVALAQGVVWGLRSAWEITRSVAEQTRDNICSTLADLQRGRTTEYESINGEILALAERCSVQVPTLRWLDVSFRQLLAGNRCQKSFRKSSLPVFSTRLSWSSAAPAEVAHRIPGIRSAL